jgi:PTH1 family peptidyl-tRNA hydrolase
LQIVLGLGNPGLDYAYTRHNVGFMLADHVAAQAGVAWTSSPAEHSEIAEVALGGRRVLLAKPQTFMNRSGRAAQALCARFAAEPSDIIVVYDDFLLDFGHLRLRRSGSDGGHNGLASVLEEFNSQDVPRLRVGIGKPLEESDVIDYVLAPFSAEEKVEELVQRSVEALDLYFAEGIEAAMNRFNGPPS